MIIEFVDPGLDWTPVFYTGFFAVAFFVAALVVNIIWAAHDYPSSYRSALPNWVAALWVGFAVTLVLGVGLGGFMTMSSIYYDKVAAAKVEALEDAGFDDIEFDYKSTTNFTASVEGDYYKGVLIDLNPEKDYEYQVTEVIK